jgi:predicted deacylase
MNPVEANYREASDIRSLLDIADSELVEHTVLNQIKYRGNTYPIHSFQIGCKDKDAPVLGLFGGVHGLEKVGTHFVTSYLENLFTQMSWDDDLRAQLKTSRIVTIPLINPVGMANNYRSNGNGVDLMRNAPIDAVTKENRPFLVAGHRLSNKIPWYRGKLGDPMELEGQTLIQYVKDQTFQSELSLTIDFHSGFGIKDRLWFPYAKTTEDYPSIEETKKLVRLIDDNLNHHIYKIEPQSNIYTTHGDLWDYIYDQHREVNQGKKLFIPWTLEMGSWTWVKKNPIQLLSSDGLFNPIKKHRYERVMRRHQRLVDLLFKATRNPKWLDLNLQ